MECTNRVPTHQYPTRFKKIAVQALTGKKMQRGKAYVNAVLNPETVNMK